MKFYAIAYELIDSKYRFYAVTSKFLDQRMPISEDFYEELKKTFTLAGKNNKSISGIYFTPEL